MERALTTDESIEELTKLYLQEQDERRRWESLVAVAAHELRHPLHLMRLALARYFPRGDERGREVMERYVDRMSRVVSDLADLIRLDRDELPLQLSWIDIAQMLREVVDAYVADAATRRVKLTLDGVVTPRWLKADEQRLLQVLSNVLDNALKFTPVGGTVLVKLTGDSQAVEINVRDTGRGISPDALPHVFDLFEGAATSPGLGIGLTVAKRIVELHKGSIAVRSDGIDCGTEVAITLPAEVASTALVARKLFSSART